MKGDVLLSLFRILFLGNGMYRFLIGVIFGLAFSIAVILSTIGIMDGFNTSLKRGLKRSVGDLKIFHRSKFFNQDDEVFQILKNLQVSQISGITQTQGFAMKEGESKGILIKGIESESFSEVTGMNIAVKSGEVAVGIELAHLLKLEVGSSLILAYGNNNNEVNGLPSFIEYKVSQIIEHGIYQKDMRLVYLNRSDVQSVLEVQNKINSISFNIPYEEDIVPTEDDYHIEKIRVFRMNILNELPYGFKVRPFWYEYGGLIEAVKVERDIISLILQLVVVVAIFNVLAFITFISEKRSQELFLYKALGLSVRDLSKIWMQMILFIWVSSCLLSVILVQIFGWGLENWSLLQLPAEVYYLGSLKLFITWSSYALVFALTFVWLLFLAWLGLWKIRKRPLLYGLRREFS